MWRPENLKKSPTFFWNNILSTVKTKCEIFSIGHSQNIWTLKREKKNLLCQQLNFIFYEKSKGFFLRYVLLFKRTFMKYFLLKTNCKKKLEVFSGCLTCRKEYWQKMLQQQHVFDWFYWIYIFLLRGIGKMVAENLNMELAPEMFFSCF